MPIISFDYEDFCSLLGLMIPRDELIDRIPMIGADVANADVEEWNVEFFPNRPDLFSVEGIARSLRNFLCEDDDIKEFDYNVEDSGIVCHVDPDIQPIRPFIGCAKVTGVRFTDELITSLMNLQEKLQLVNLVFVESFKSDTTSFGGQKFNVFMIDMRYMDFNVIHSLAGDAIEVEDISNQKNIDLRGIVPVMFTHKVLKSKAPEAYILYFSDTAVFSTERCEGILMRYETNIFSMLNAHFSACPKSCQHLAPLLIQKLQTNL